MNDSIKKRIFEMADEDYRIFQSRLCPQNDNIIGVRLPKLRKLANEISKGDWRSYLESAGDEYYEETMLQGMVIGCIEAGVDEKLECITKFIPKIDNWAVCDSFCSGLKFTKSNVSRMWQYIQPLIKSDREFEMRFAIVMMLNYYVEQEYVEKVLGILEAARHDGYYVKMAIAWAVSICYIKFPQITMEYLKVSDLEDFTYNKALQKITESLRVDNESKAIIRKMKRI